MKNATRGSRSPKTSTHLTRRRVLFGSVSIILLQSHRTLALNSNESSRVLAENLDAQISLLASNERAVADIRRDRSDEEELAATGNLQQERTRAAPSTRTISDRASALIKTSEVGSETLYSRHYRSPTWPNGYSGITIGIGYDLGYVGPTWFAEDWLQYLSTNQIQMLQPLCRRTGIEAAKYLASVSQIDIPWDTADRQFYERELPLFIGAVEKTLENCNILSDDSLGALVSLAYNRGTACFRVPPDLDPNKRFVETRAIRGLMREKRFSEIPDQIRSMKRLWKHNADSSGLLIRRDLEASLFELGLTHKS
jgi:hypothetical protein